MKARSKSSTLGTAPCKGSFFWSGSGSVPLVSPTYSFDIALRVYR